MKTTPIPRHASPLAPNGLGAGKTLDVDFHGASIITEQGEEIPITEAMVQQACKIFIQQWEMAQNT